jgi:tol-pal system protein YbgF
VRSIHRIAIVTAVFGCVLGSLEGAFAQNPEVRELVNRIERLQRELVTLQQQVYRGNPPPASIAAEAASGDSRATAQLSVRLSQLETEIRSITGKTEELEYGLRQLSAKVDRLVAETEGRTKPPEAGQPTAGMPPATPGGMPVVPPQVATTGAPDAAPGTLGVLPRSQLNAPAGQQQQSAATSPGPKSSLPQGTPRQQYDHAVSLMLQQQNFGEAEKALKEFVTLHPTDPLAGSAHYWLGETHFVRKDYQQAAFVFADAFQKYPDGQKAPDSLFKLGMSLAELGKTKEACTAFERLERNYPKASANLKSRISVQQRKLKCQG